MLQEFVRWVARARGLEAPAQLASRLHELGHDVSLQAVCQWWSGPTRRLGAKGVRAVLALDLEPEELAALTVLQAGLADDVPTEAA